MISTEVISKIRLSTCAVLRMPVRHEEALRSVKPEDKVPPPAMDVAATAFLIRENLLLTNRHVVVKIAEEHNRTGNHDHWYVQFTYPRDGVTWSQTIKRVNNLFCFLDPRGGRLDVGLLSFTSQPGELGPCRPVEFGSLESVRVGEDVGVCGFPFGNVLLLNPDMGVQRVGPVVHRGMISAVSPYDSVDARSIAMFLTDLNAGEGMSGSPVFLPDNGRVIGLHYAGMTGTLGGAVPVDQRRVKEWIGLYERSPMDPKRMTVGNIRIKPGGDLDEDLAPKEI